MNLLGSSHDRVGLVDGTVVVVVERRFDDDVTYVSLIGELDLACVEPVLTLLANEPLTPEWRLDLKNVTFIDCAGLRLLCALQQQIRRGGAVFTIGSTCPSLTRLLQLTDPSNLPFENTIVGVPKVEPPDKPFASQPPTTDQLRPNADGLPT